MAYKADHDCPLHTGVQCQIRFMLISTDGDFVFCSTCPRCYEHGHPNPTNWIVVDCTEEELSLFLSSGQPELRSFYVKSAVQIRSGPEPEGGDDDEE